MNVNIAKLRMPTPVQAVQTDDPARILEVAQRWFNDGPVALATLVEIRGGAAKPLGSQMAIAADGRFCGYVSGGCVEAAVASEALMAMANGCDRTVMFGEGSPFFDIVLPCGGGISVAIHLVRDVGAIKVVLSHLGLRRETGLRYSRNSGLLECVAPCLRTHWAGDQFTTIYRPSTRIMVSGASLEADAVSRLGDASGYEIFSFDGTRQSNDFIDGFTAVVLLHHDLEREVAILKAALSSSAFYIGCLGSTRTHRKRVDRLLADGHDRKQVDRIRAPIGLFGPARDSSSMALSVLADVAATRLATYP